MGTSRGKRENSCKMLSAWFSAALEQLAQVCGSFLEVTASTFTSSQRGKMTRSPPHVHIVVIVGDAIDLCDALVTSRDGYCAEESGTRGESAAVGGAFPSVAFQQGSIQPMVLRAEAFNEASAESGPEFDVINTSNLVDHLGESCRSTHDRYHLRDCHNSSRNTAQHSLNRFVSSDYLPLVCCCSPSIAESILHVPPSNQRYQSALQW